LSGTDPISVYTDVRVASAVTGGLIGYNLRMDALAGSYTISNMYGLKTNTPVVQSGVTVTNSYGIYIGRTDDPTSGGVVTNRYALVTEANAGNVGIGTTSPSEKLDVNGNIKATNLLSGTYTPTLTLVGNPLGSIAVSVCLYTRVGNLVTVTGTISGVGSGTGIQQYSYDLSLPITQTNTNLRGTATGSGQVIGGIGTNGLNGYQFNINKMSLDFQSINTYTGVPLFWNFTFTYEIA
jgi:hypothetical protein